MARLAKSRRFGGGKLKKTDSKMGVKEKLASSAMKESEVVLKSKTREIEARALRLSQTFKSGDEEFRVTKITPGRIVAREIILGNERTFRPADKVEIVGRPGAFQGDIF